MSSPFPLPVLPDDPPEPRYWRSLEERVGAVQSPAPEFSEGADLPPQGLARRQFLSLAGAAVAASACVTKPAEHILPYNRTPPELTPGNPLHYATAVERDGLATGLLVTSWDGRPIKVEGNPDHPASLGAVGPQELALTQQLYDPSRARLLKRDQRPVAWRTFLLSISESLEGHARDGGARLRFLVEPTSSPTLLWLRARIAERFPLSRVVAYASAGRENAYRGAALAFGKPYETHLDFSKADAIVSLDSDFLRPEGRHLRHTRQFADRRDPARGQLNRLYSVEPLFTVTGGMADHRLRCTPTEVGAFALLLAGEVARLLKSPLDPAVASPAVAHFSGRPDAVRFARAAAADLVSRNGRALVVAGRSQPPPVHLAAHAINAALKSEAETFTEPATPDVETGPRALAELAVELRAGRVDALCVTARNPVYGAPVDVDLARGLHRVRDAIYLSTYEDETAAHCRWFIPATHPLESWGDARGPDGTASIIQPLISPMFSGVTEVELLAAFLGHADQGARGLVREYWRQTAPATDFERRWDEWLARGVVPDTELPRVSPALEWGEARRALASLGSSAQRAVELELQLYADTKVGDGRTANVAWLQELPNPITKLTWDNAALLSPKTAAQLQVGTGDLLQLTLRGRSVKAPALVVPGQADGVVGAALGYGRAGAEGVALGVGFNAGELRDADAHWFARGLLAKRLPFERRQLAVTQQHWSTEGRPIALTATAEEHRRDPDATETQRGPLPTLQKPVQYPDHKWGMSVDLSRCTGCSACVVACQSENNIPTVGREQVLRSREMQWLRIDRYFEGPLDTPTMVTQPVMCQHCEAAPCEYVCPTNATVHSDEGLNEMIYNRCVGTRYCQNNCPYKVRRFNFLHFTEDLGPMERMAMNPDVTVRARGVMEKCTYCVQRIERARIDTRVDGRRIKDGDIVTACQQACPATAIVFGDLNDPTAAVTRLHAEPRRYDLLHELNTRPRTAYLVRIRNPNPELS